MFNQTYDEVPEALFEAVRMCSEQGADVNSVNSMGIGAVHGAASRGSDDIIAFLHEKGARLDVPDAVGRMPLIWAGRVFLAPHPPEPKPSTVARLTELLDADSPASKCGRLRPARSKNGFRDASCGDT